MFPLTFIPLVEAQCIRSWCIESLYLYKYSSIMRASTATVIAWRHIHIYRTIVSWSTQCYSCQSSQAKQCHMTQLRETTEILFFCLYVYDLQKPSGKGADCNFLMPLMTFFLPWCVFELITNELAISSGQIANSLCCANNDVLEFLKF